ncbi:hypothetical protein RCH10_005136 [Variovorax sp. GrIS 2.14]|uniref:hypothetical protein n=1 Tax=Variovorax sp. GrIS 2.14 TaxID=3071709 RepID=UPI0038F60E77
MQDDIIEQAIALRAGDVADSGLIADAVVTTLRLLHAELSVLVGAQAAAALCSHAMHRTQSEVEWAAPRAAALSESMLLALRADLQARTPEQALFAGKTLLFALTDHLKSLIGEPLTTRMLRSAWGTPAFDQISTEDIR